MKATQTKASETMAAKTPAARPAPRALAQAPTSVYMPTAVYQFAGNMAMQRRLGTGVIQAKLNVSHPGDFYEHEADRVAEEVLRVPGETPVRTAPGRAEPHTLQRKCGCEDTLAQSHACDTCREKQVKIQRRPASHEGDAKGHPDVKDATGVQEALRAAGRPLDAETRAFFEPRFGRNLGGVRVHSDASAGASAKSLNALAYTVGRDIVFGQGQYDAGSRAGRQLLAHELAHVIQQDFGAGLGAASAGPLVQRQPPPGNGGDAGTQTSAEPATQTGPNAPIELPPEHAERLELLEEMRLQIEEETQRRAEFQEQYRAIPLETSKEAEASRATLKAELTSVEEHLVLMLQGRIDFIGETIRGLEEVLPGNSPHAPTGQTSPQDDKAASDYTVRSEIMRLDQERRENQAQQLSLKRCLARKRVRDIKAELAKSDTSPEAREELEAEKAEKEKFLKTSAADVKCAKSPSETKHPTEVSSVEFERLKKGECFVSFPYIAEEGKTDEAKTGGNTAEDEKKKEKAKKKKSTGAGCTIGFGHVIRSDEAKCTHGKGAPEKHKCGTLSRCDCTPALSMSLPQAEKKLQEDIDVHARWIKEHVLVDLDQGQFDALVDISLHHGSISADLLNAVNTKLCTDDEAVRRQYMKTDLFIKDQPQRGPVFAKRREERVWEPKGDEDPNCI